MAETWKIAGEHLAACSCKVSPCPCTAAGGNPTEGKCKAYDVFSITQGNYGELDLSGVKVAMVLEFPGYILDGNWRIGLVVDEGASDAQVEAVGTIMGGQAGGQFAEFAKLVADNLGVSRAQITYDRAEGSETGSIKAGNTHYEYTPLQGPGGRTQLLHGALAFRDKIFPGKSQGGHIDELGIQTDTYYGEWSEIEFAGP